MDCSKVPKMKCEVPAQLKQKWAMNIKDQVKKVNFQMQKKLDIIDGWQQKHLAHYQKDLAKAQLDLQRAKERGAVTPLALYSVEYVQLRITQTGPLFALKKKHVRETFERLKTDFQSQAMQKIEQETTGGTFQQVRTRQVKLAYQNEIERIELNYSQGKQYESTRYLQALKRVKLAEDKGLAAIASMNKEKAKESYNRRREQLNKNRAASKNASLKKYKTAEQNITKAAKELERKAKLLEKQRILKEQLKRTKELSQKMAASAVNLGKRILKVTAHYNRKIGEATRKGKRQEAQKLTNERNTVLGAIRKSTANKQRGLATKLTQAENDAINKYKAAEAKEQKQQALIESTSKNLGSAKVTIPDNYVPPELVKGVFTLNFGASLGIHNADISPLYDIACVKHSDEKSKLLQVLGNLEANIRSGVFPFNDDAAVALSTSESFIAFWTNMREYCQKLTDGLVPKDRALQTFFNTKFSAVVMNQINLVNNTENAQVTGVALFFDQLAQWATTRARDQARCSCEDITDLIQTGIAPDLTEFPDAKKAKVILPELMNQVAATCLKRYPTQCKLSAAAVKTLEADLQEDADSLDMMTRIMSQDLDDLAE